MLRRWVGGVALVLALAGCEAVSDEQEAAYAAEEAVSSHLVNASTVPITYTASDPSKKLTLAPGDEVTLPGGAWAVPKGWRCSWKFTDEDEESGATTAGSDDYTTWTTFGGYDETVTSCTGPVP